MNEQEIKIKNVKNDSEVFFFKHSFKSAKQHADDYIKRNKGKFPMQMFMRSNKPKPFPLWDFICKA